MGLILGFATLPGLPRFFAACYRLFKRRITMSNRQVFYTRLCLNSGMIASALLLISVIYFELGIFAIGFFTLLISGGAGFVSATARNI